LKKKTIILTNTVHDYPLMKYHCWTIETKSKPKLQKPPEQKAEIIINKEFTQTILGVDLRKLP
jgi:hypothetical protein